MNGPNRSFGAPMSALWAGAVMVWLGALRPLIADIIEKLCWNRRLRNNRSPGVSLTNHCCCEVMPRGSILRPSGAKIVFQRSQPNREVRARPTPLFAPFARCPTPRCTSRLPVTPFRHHQMGRHYRSLVYRRGPRVGRVSAADRFPARDGSGGAGPGFAEAASAAGGLLQVGGRTEA